MEEFDDDDDDDFGLGQYQKELRDMDIAMEEFNDDTFIQNYYDIDEHDANGSDQDEDVDFEEAYEDEEVEENDKDDLIDEMVGDEFAGHLDEEEEVVKEKEDQELASSIMSSIQTVLPLSRTASTPIYKPSGPIKMTDLGYQISQLILMRQSGDDPKVNHDEYQNEGKDILLEQHISGQRRNKTVQQTGKFIF